MGREKGRLEDLILYQGHKGLAEDGLRPISYRRDATEFIHEVTKVPMKDIKAVYDAYQYWINKQFVRDNIVAAGPLGCAFLNERKSWYKYENGAVTRREEPVIKAKIGFFRNWRLALRFAIKEIAKYESTHGLA